MVVAQPTHRHVRRMDNPYQSPLSENNAPLHPSASSDLTQLLVAWPFLLAINLGVPLMFGWPMVEQHGKLGLVVAIALFAVGGWLLCFYSPAVARRLLVGSIVIAATQLFPILHMIVGIIAIGIVERTGHGEIADDFAGGDQITSAFGGFLATTITGCALAVCALGAGYVILAIRGAMRDAA